MITLVACTKCAKKMNAVKTGAVVKIGETYYRGDTYSCSDCMMPVFVSDAQGDHEDQPADLEVQANLKDAIDIKDSVCISKKLKLKESKMEIDAKKKDEKKEEKKDEKKGKKKIFPFWLGKKKKKAELLTSLTVLADSLDSKGLTPEANQVDEIVKEVATDPKKELVAKIMSYANDAESAEKSEFIQEALLPMLSTEQLQNIVTQQESAPAEA